MSAIEDDTKSKQHLAQERTETAYQRTFLAEERTFSAWVRTGLAAIATGFAIAKLMGETDPAWLLPLLSVLFIAAGGCMFLVGFWTYRNAIQSAPVPASGGAPVWIIGSLSLALVLCTAAAMALLLLE